MDGFTFYNPTKIYFGEGAISNLSSAVSPYSTVLVVYGGGSIKRNGVYTAVKAQLEHAGKKTIELGGVTPNPRTEKVYEGIALCRAHDVDLILAVGGGSTIDCAKAIAVGACSEQDFWNTYYLEKKECMESIPLGAVLTLAGSGSEMDGRSVISNMNTHLKLACRSRCMQPKFSILDPTYTYSLPRSQTINGAIDSMTHIFETYFSAPDTPNVSDAIAEALLGNIIEALPRALESPSDYNARSNLMWDSTLAINGLTALGKVTDWETHQIEHQLSAFYDIPHGAGLAIVFPAYMRYTYAQGLAKYVRYAEKIWGITSGTADERAIKGIECTANFFRQVGAPTSLRQVDIPRSAIEKIAPTIRLYTGGYRPLTTDDVIEILKNCAE